MGLLEALYGRPEQRQRPQRPDPVVASPSAREICAPCTGRLMVMRDIPDQIFASGVMGPAVAIKPRSGAVYAPVSGVITMVTNTLHALGVQTDGGMQLLIHVGVDTVNMRGEGFCGFVEKGQRVVAGEALVVFDQGLVAQAGCDDTVILALVNAEEHPLASTALAGDVQAGDVIMSVAG